MFISVLRIHKNIHNNGCRQIFMFMYHFARGFYADWDTAGWVFLGSCLHMVRKGRVPQFTSYIIALTV